MKLRKVMLLAAMLAMVLAAAAPALAQVDLGDEVQYVDCSQVQAAVGAQYGDANAGADDGSVAAAAAELGISQSQVNACLGGIDVDNGDDGGTVVAGGGGTVAADDGGSAAAAAGGGSAAAAGGSAAAATETLPETGGASLLALGAGALLVAGGLVARRIVR